MSICTVFCETWAFVLALVVVLADGRFGDSCHPGLPSVMTVDQDVSIEAMGEKFVTEL